MAALCWGTTVHPTGEKGTAVCRWRGLEGETQVRNGASDGTATLSMAFFIAARTLPGRYLKMNSG